MNIKNSKYFTGVMDKIFPLWSNFNIDTDSIYWFNAFFRFIFIKQYGDEIITKQNELKSMMMRSYDIGDISDNEYVSNEIARFTNPGFYLVLCSTEIIDQVSLKGDFVELNSSTYPINAFIKSGSRKATRVFINSGKQQVVACLTGRVTENWMGRFLSCISRIWQWVFNDKNTTDEELALLKACSECNWDEVIERLNAMAPDYTDKYIKSFLSIYQKSFIDAETNEFNNRITQLRNEILNYESRLNEALNNLSGCNLKLQSLQMLKLTQQDEITPFFESHKSIKIEDVQIGNSSTPCIYYTINETLEYYDADEFMRIYKNKRGSYLSDADDKITKILYEMFCNEKGHFVVQSEFKLSKLSSLTPLSYGTLNGVSYNNVLPHPHLGFYRCLGANENEIYKAMLNGNWDIAIEQSIAATKNLNFGDNAVMTRLLDYLSEHRNYKFILADNGERMSINEFADYIGYKEADNG